VLKTENIVKRYRDHKALDKVSIHVQEQRIFGLLGPNGAGKTSLIRIINQITGPDEGRIHINGQPLERNHISLIGYLPEERGLYKKMKVGEQAVYLAQLKGMKTAVAKKKLREWFERFEMGTWWNKPIEDLSKGMAQKVQFITTVLHEPKLLILDEPFSGFDPINANLIKDEIMRLRDEGATIMLSTHNMGSVEEICDDIALINQGKVILDGTVNQVKKDFSKAEFDIHFEGHILGFTNALWTGFELLDKEVYEDKTCRARVRLLEDSTVNTLLSNVLPEVKIKGVTEVIPSMNDIFIAAVSGEKKPAIQ